MSGLKTYEVGGTGRPLLIVHGYTGSGNDFREVGERLTDLRRVILVDHLGHGESPRSLHYDVATLTRAVLEVLMVDVGQPVDLLAHSMGGPVTLPIAIGQPELVRSLILMDTYADSPDRGPEVADLLAMLALPVDEAYDAVVAEWNAHLSDEEQLFRRLRGEEWAVARTSRNRAMVDPRALVELGRELMGGMPSILDACASISCPTTVIRGEHDVPFIGTTDRLAATIPGAHLHVIEGAYHSPQHSHPDAWLAIVREHLERV